MTKKRRRKTGSKRRHHRKAAAPKKRRHARRAHAAPKKRRHARRAHAPKKRRHARRAHAAPRRRRRISRTTTTRVTVSNPRRKRRHRRNPSLPMWAQAAIGAALGMVSWAAVEALAYSVTQRTDPSLATVVRNRVLGGLAVAGAGIFAAMKHPLIGASVAAGGLTAAAGTPLALAIGKVTDLPITPKVGALGSERIPPLLSMGAVGTEIIPPMGAIASDSSPFGF